MHVISRTGGLSAALAIWVILAGVIGGTAQAQGAESVPPDLSQSEVSTLLERAQEIGHVETVEAVTSSAGKAQVALDPQITEAGLPGAAVDLVVMHGSFTDTLAKEPRGEPAPSGAVLAYTIDPTTGTVASTYIGNHSPALATLGAVARITPTHLSATATASRVGHRTLRHHQPMARTATWGNDCKVAEAYHCYAVAEWSMTGNERVYGTESEQKTTEMNVPGWENGDFVDDEEWAAFPSTGLWVEAGQEAGNYRNCCNLFWFFAWETSSGYSQFTGPPYTWEVTYNTWNNYGMQWVGNGEWCIFVGPTWEQKIACHGGFSADSTLLEDGMEAATEKKPTNKGVAVANATWEGSTHTWNKARNVSTTTGLCVSQFTPVNFPGNINYSTC
jgi:hypothetical protein